MPVFHATLPAVELESLRQISLGAQAHIGAGHGETLVRRGFAGMKAGAFTVTPLGHAKLVLEITRSTWLGAPVRG